MLTALLVDDDADFLEGLAEVAAHEGFAVTPVRSLQQAREHLAKGPADLVLIDLKLPDGDGTALLREIKEASHSDVVLMSGVATVDSAYPSTINLPANRASLIRSMSSWLIGCVISRILHRLRCQCKQRASILNVVVMPKFSRHGFAKACRSISHEHARSKRDRLGKDGERRGKSARSPGESRSCVGIGRSSVCAGWRPP